MRHRLLLIISVLWTTLSFGQTTKEEDFVWTLKRVVTDLSNRDSVKLSRYVDKKNGVYILDRIGVYENYQHFKNFGFKDTTYPNFPFYDDIKLTPLKYSKLPTFDCEKWTKTGTFVDTTRIDHLLSKIAGRVKKNFRTKVPAKTIHEFYSLENRSRRVVITSNAWNGLIIYLSFIHNKWVLTIIDKATCDCSV